MSAAAAPRKLRGTRPTLEPAAIPGGRTRARRLAAALVGPDAGVRATGVLFAGVIAGHFVWLLSVFNTDRPVMASVFLAGIAIVDIYGLLSIVNSWHVARPVLRRLEAGAEPTVAVLIPTCGEPIEMVLATLRSVLEQDWPHDRLVIVLGDDRHNPAVREAVKRFRAEHRYFTLHYHQPPAKSSPLRQGEAKAGNLNSCLKYVTTIYPSVTLIETRDADDLVGSREFLRYAVGHLVDHPDASFVQTIKRCHVPGGDPFSNQEPVFYERVMPMRQAANATFPCGSGLVWRLSGLRSIGGFPTWNLVEDLQSGFELLKRGGKGLYVPIVGSVAQVAPVDIPNLYKQRGTWALDSARLFLWKNPFLVRGLTLRQRLQFFELNWSYVTSFAVLLFVISIIGSLVAGAYPTDGSAPGFVVAMLLLAAASEGYYRLKAGHVSYREQWRSRQIWTGLMFIYMFSLFRALAYGPNGKPLYVVTRKHRVGGWHWRGVLPQLATIAALLSAIVYAAAVRRGFGLVDLISIFWALFFVYSLLHIVKLSRFRDDPRASPERANTVAAPARSARPERGRRPAPVAR